MWKYVVRTVILAWGVMVMAGTIYHGNRNYHLLKAQWEQDNTLHEACHDRAYFMRNPNDCAYIFTNEPRLIQFIAQFVLDTLRAVDKCGVPCSDVFTFWSILKFGALNWIVDIRKLRPLVDKVRNKYKEYKLLQMKKNN